MADRKKTSGEGVRYEKNRVYVRGLEMPSYGLDHEVQRIRKEPRVISARDLPRKGGPQVWNRDLMRPNMGLSQALDSHIVEYAPGGRSGCHGHTNEALFYILDGKGYDIHDGKRYEYEEGDLVVVHNNCVHEHFNADNEKVLRALVLKSKTLFMFMNLIFQDNVTQPPKEPVPGLERWEPPEF